MERQMMLLDLCPETIKRHVAYDEDKLHLRDYLLLTPKNLLTEGVARYKITRLSHYKDPVELKLHVYLQAEKEDWVHHLD